MDWGLSQRRGGGVGGHFSEERRVSGGKGWKCEGWLNRSLAGNLEEAGDDSWGVLALLLSCSPDSLFPLFLPCLVK